MEYTNRIETNPAICHGKPVIKGTRIMVTNILGMFEGGYNIDDVLADYPTLTREDVVAALQFATELVNETRVIFA
ncbi:MAG: DUF433 domain-containing protein [Acidobacteriaceae bacterium]